MKTAPLPLIATLALGFTASVNATPISGDPMMGVVGTGFGDTNTGLIESQQGTLNLLTDSNLSTSNDTWNRGGSTNFDFVGLRFTTPEDGVNSIQVNVRVFGDGGWWVSNTPKVQVTTNADFASYGIPGFHGGPPNANNDGIWSDVAFTSDYPLDATDGSPGSVTDGGLYTFSLNTPVDGVYGIRVIGDAGGFAGTDSDGDFIGAYEVMASAVPEPSSVALILLGGLALVRRRFTRG